MKKLRTEKLIFYVCLITSIGLMVGGFFVPPTGVIDGSVLKGVGALFGFASLDVIHAVIKTEKDIHFSNGDISIDVTDDNDNKDNVHNQ